jgi:hypothetical protein
MSFKPCQNEKDLIDNSDLIKDLSNNNLNKFDLNDFD